MGRLPLHSHSSGSASRAWPQVSGVEGWGGRVAPPFSPRLSIPPTAAVYYASLLPALPSFYVYVTTTLQGAVVSVLTLLWAQSIVVPNLNWNTPLWQASAFAFTYPFFPPALACLRTWSTTSLRRALVWLMLLNVAVVFGGFLVIARIGINIGVLHRWAPFRLPQFIAGICTGLLAQRGDIAHASVKADIVTAVLALSALVACPLLVRFHPVFLICEVAWRACTTPPRQGALFFLRRSWHRHVGCLRHLGRV